MTENNYCIYVHTNKFNGKKYIGQTCRSPKIRWKNGEGYKKSPYFYHAIKKYGWDCFEHEILYINLSCDDANKIENNLITLFNTNDPNFGYNIKDGGGGGGKLPQEIKNKISNSLKGRPGVNKGKKFGPMSKEQKQKISKANKGHHHTEKTKRKMSESHIGKNNPFYGKHHTKKAREKISKAGIGNKYNLGKHHSDETKKKLSEKFSGVKNPSYGKHWFTNGTINIFCKKCPIGFTKGMIKKRKYQQ